MERRAGAGVTGIGVLAAGDQRVDFGTVLGHGGRDMDDLRPVAQPEPSVHPVCVDHLGRVQAFLLVWRPPLVRLC